MFRNEAFEAKIADVQRQIEELKAGKEVDTGYQVSPGRVSKTHSISKQVSEDQVDEFYDEMRKFYKNPAKHKSPTRRLRKQIDAAWEHKTFLSNQPEY